MDILMSSSLHWRTPLPMPIHDAAYNGSPCVLQVLARAAISLAKFTPKLLPLHFFFGNSSSG